MKLSRQAPTAGKSHSDRRHNCRLRYRGQSTRV